MPQLGRFITAILLTAAIAGFVVRLSMLWAVADATSPELADSGTPRLQLITDEQDLGQVRLGSPLQAVFCIANTGTGRLILRQARRSRDRQPPATMAVEPGQTNELVIHVDAKQLLPSGIREIRFLTNDPVQPELWLTVRGTVVNPPPAGGGLWFEEPMKARSALSRP